MCVTLLSTAHPEYALILLNNRDEFLNRPTAQADWWESPHQHVLGGRDLQRAERGTWLAITKQGRICNLTNFRDEGVEIEKGKSRGALVKAYVDASPELVAEQTDDKFINQRLIQDIGIHNVGGFSLLFGRLRAAKDGQYSGLSIVSNRTSSSEGVTRIATKPRETHGLSNSHFGDLTWPKVVHGEQLLRQTISSDVSRGSDETRLITSLFDILSVDMLPRPRPGQPWEEYTRQLRNSILVPPVGGSQIDHQPADKVAAAGGTDTPDHGNVVVGQGIYGTHRQTVILVRHDGRVKFVERALYDDDAKKIELEDADRTFEFQIEGWEE